MKSLLPTTYNHPVPPPRSNQLLAIWSLPKISYANTYTHICYSGDLCFLLSQSQQGLQENHQASASTLYQKYTFLSNYHRSYQPINYFRTVSVNVEPCAVLGHKTSKHSSLGYLPFAWDPHSPIPFCLPSVFVCFVSWIALFLSLDMLSPLEKHIFQEPLEKV